MGDDGQVALSALPASASRGPLAAGGIEQSMRVGTGPLASGHTGSRRTQLGVLIGSGFIQLPIWGKSSSPHPNPPVMLLTTGLHM